MAEVLGPAADELRPVVRALGRANVATRPFALEAAPLLRNDIRPFVREARPLVRELRSGRRTTSSRPSRTSSARCTSSTSLFNLLAFNDKGREGPEVADRDEGYLFYLAWLAHQSVTLFSGQDAHGVFRPLVARRHLQHARRARSTPSGRRKPAASSRGICGVAASDNNVCGGGAGR